MFKKPVIGIFAFLLILFFCCSAFYHELLFRMPYGTHTWAQADRLSLAMKFYDNGMNFFRPATYTMYPENGITGVEFPIQAYIAALAGKVFGRAYISTGFRLLDVIISCTGGLFLFLAAYSTTRDFIISLITPLFAFCSPVFTYYTCNYLPDTAAASIAFIAFYYILRYSEGQSVKHFIKAVILLTLATLIKTSVGLYLCGFLLWVVYTRVKAKQLQPRASFSFYITSLLCIGVIIGYYLYNKYLNTTYHSGVFLATVNPFRSVSDVKRYLHDIKHVWIWEYFLPVQYLLLVICTAGAVPILFKSNRGKNILLLWVLFICGILAMTLLFGRQLYNHDYYAASIFLPFAIFVLLVSVITLRKAVPNPVILTLMRTAGLATVMLCFFMANYHIHQRLLNGVGGYNEDICWAEGGADVLYNLHIPKNEPIMVLNEADPNTHLLFFDRNGINIDSSQWSHVKNISMLLPQMWEYGMHIIVCKADLGQALVATDTSLATYFNTLYLRNNIAVFERK